MKWLHTSFKRWTGFFIENVLIVYYLFLWWHQAFEMVIQSLVSVIIGNLVMEHIEDTLEIYRWCSISRYAATSILLITVAPIPEFLLQPPMTNWSLPWWKELYYVQLHFKLTKTLINSCTGQNTPIAFLNPYCMVVTNLWQAYRMVVMNSWQAKKRTKKSNYQLSDSNPDHTDARPRLYPLGHQGQCM